MLIRILTAFFVIGVLVAGARSTVADTISIFEGAAEFELPDGYYREEGRSDQVESFIFDGAPERLEAPPGDVWIDGLKATIQIMPLPDQSPIDDMIAQTEDHMRRLRASGRGDGIAGTRTDAETGMTHVVYMGLFFGYWVCKPTDRGDVCFMGQDDAVLRTMKQEDYPAPDVLMALPLEEIVRSFEEVGNAADVEQALSTFRWR